MNICEILSVDVLAHVLDYLNFASWICVRGTCAFLRELSKEQNKIWDALTSAIHKRGMLIGDVRCRVCIFEIRCDAFARRIIDRDIGKYVSFGTRKPVGLLASLLLVKAVTLKRPDMFGLVLNTLSSSILSLRAYRSTVTKTMIAMMDIIGWKQIYEVILSKEAVGFLQHIEKFQSEARKVGGNKTIITSRLSPLTDIYEERELFLLPPYSYSNRKGWHHIECNDPECTGSARVSYGNYSECDVFQKWYRLNSRELNIWTYFSPFEE